MRNMHCKVSDQIDQLYSSLGISKKDFAIKNTLCAGNLDNKLNTTLLDVDSKSSLIGVVDNNDLKIVH